MNTTNSYQSKSHTYSFLPDSFEVTDEIKDIFEDAPNYSDCVSIKISPRLFQYLVNEYHFKLETEETGEYTIIFKNTEQIVNVVTVGDFIHMLMFRDKDDVINELMYDEIFKCQSMISHGLEKFLDPNYGGSVSEIHLNIASEIIFG